MIGFDELLRRFAGLERTEFVRWVENRWVVPDQQAADQQQADQQPPNQQAAGAGERWTFREVDIARVELILHIRREYAIDDEATSLVLGLLDQVYQLRRQMRRLCDAVEAQPPEIRDAVRQALPPVGSNGGP